MGFRDDISALKALLEAERRQLASERASLQRELALERDKLDAAKSVPAPKKARPFLRRDAALLLVVLVLASLLVSLIHLQCSGPPLPTASELRREPAPANRAR